MLDWVLNTPLLALHNGCNDKIKPFLEQGSFRICKSKKILMWKSHSASSFLDKEQTECFSCIFLEFQKLHWVTRTFSACLVNAFSPGRQLPKIPYNRFFQISKFYVDAPKNFAKFKRKHLSRSLFLIKLQVSILQLYWKRRLRHRCFFWEQPQETAFALRKNILPVK